MIEIQYKNFAKSFYDKLKTRKPLHGQIELTYRCEFRCLYCYLRPYQSNASYEDELSIDQWKRILDELHTSGCISLTFTGGDPLLRSDFSKIYLYAKRKGFIITVFTNAASLTAKMLKLFKKYTPFSIEITLNSLVEDRFDMLTGTNGNFKSSIANIRRAAEMKLPVILKTNGLVTNKDEVVRIKNFATNLLGAKRYKFDTYITPALNGDKTPLKLRLSSHEIIELEESDEEIKEAVRESYEEDRITIDDKDGLYRCNTWLSSFFIDPQGRLKFCHLTNKFSADLKKSSFEIGFYKIFPKLKEAKFTKYTKCRTCDLKFECMACPARSYLEIGDEEEPVSYFCELAKMRAEKRKRFSL